MVILTAEGLSKSYGVDLLFDGVSFGISDTDKIGIVGANGAGKSTLLRILVGQEAPDTGQIALNRQARVEILAQQPDLQDDLTALEQVLTDGPAEFQVAQRYAHALAQLAERPQDHALLDKLSLLQQEMDRVGAWTLESEARIILTQLGLDDPHQRVGAMSGGQQKRVALARALIRPSDLLILDEPTNHLDVQTVAWLERYLAQRPGALLMVTHDRYVLDRVANVIFELAEGSLHRHEANYSTFVQTRAQRMIEREQAHHRLTQLAKKELEWLRRGPKARTTKARSRVDRATALQEAAAQGPEGLRKVELDAVSQRLGKKIVELEAVSKSFDGRLVLAPFSYVFSRGERLGLVGPNGAGKSTLLNLITGQLEPDAGERQVGQSVVFGYYDQRAQRLDESERVYDYIAKRSNVITTREGSLSASQMLERFLFSRARQYSPISKLSGGERRRLYLLRVLMEQPNVLILDEPTNDLDIETLTVLEDFLDQFEGVLIVVSHDRYFLDRTVEHLLVFQGQGRLVEFPGNMSQWLEAQQSSPQTSPQAASQAASQSSSLEAPSGQPLASSKPQSVGSSSTASAPATTPGAAKPRQKLSYKDQRDLDALPGQIEALEAKLAALDDELSRSSSDYARLESLSADRAQLAATLEAALERWMALEELVGS